MDIIGGCLVQKRYAVVIATTLVVTTTPTPTPTLDVVNIIITTPGVIIVYA